MNKTRVLLVAVAAGFISMAVSAESQDSRLSELVNRLEAYGQCIDDENSSSPIRSMAALEAANAQCDRYLREIRALDSRVADLLDEHMKNRVKELANQSW